MPLLAALASSCVINRPVRPSLPESARGPSAQPVTGSPVLPQTVPEGDDDSPPTTSKPGAVWVRGYWHWDGVRYVWERGRWETLAATTK
jgi:YXWGXW repeat-containing protein